MRLPRVRFTVRQLMGAVAVIALLLYMTRSLPHVQKCWRRAARDDVHSQAYHTIAVRIRNCPRTLACPGPSYPFHPCPSQVSTGTAYDPASDDYRDRSLAAHRQAASAFEDAAAWHAATARHYRRALFFFWESIGDWDPTDESRTCSSVGRASAQKAKAE